MLVSKHAAELCAHLVNDLFGELPARIVAVLFSKGKLTVSQLTQQTALPPRQLRHGLAVLVQQNLLYYDAANESPFTCYEANPDACYHLIRFGKIVDMIGAEFGLAEQEVFQTLMQLGHARVSDLVQAFGFHVPSSNQPVQNGSLMNGERTSHSRASARIHSLQHLYAALGRLIIAETIDQVGPKTFRNPNDVYREIEREATKTMPGEKSTKNKDLVKQEIATEFQSVLDESKKLKRQLDRTMPFSVKRRKLGSGAHTNGFSHASDACEIDPNVVLKVNFEKCLVDLRNRTLSRHATDSLGHVTGQVYLTLLRLLSDRIPQCRRDPRVDTGNSGEESSGGDDFGDQHAAQLQTSVTALQVFEALDTSVDVTTGLGKTPRDKIDVRNAERIRGTPKLQKYDSDDSDDEVSVPGRAAVHFGDSERDEYKSGDEQDVGTASHGFKEGEPGNSRVKFENGSDGKDARFDHMRQHLLILAESQQSFVRHCGTQGRGQWTVDFEQVVSSLRQAEADAVIEQTFGRHGLRLTRILRGKGKLDEKTLPTMALMKKQDVQGKMLALQMAGFVDIQEVPRDNSRLANRTLFFWYFDEERVRNQLLDDFYKTMLRCLQTLDVQRHRERNILSFVERKDVRGKEEEVMTAEHYNKYSLFLELQSKLLGHVMRLDDLVSIFKDF